MHFYLENIFLYLQGFTHFLQRTQCFHRLPSYKRQINGFAYWTPHWFYLKTELLMYSSHCLQEQLLCRQDCNSETTVLRICENHRWNFEISKFYNFKAWKKMYVSTEHSWINSGLSGKQQTCPVLFTTKGIKRREINSQWVMEDVVWR